MAFCNSCGNALAPGTKFCPKCGVESRGIVSPSATVAGSALPIATVPQSNSGLKTVLIVLGVLFALFILGTAMTIFVGWHIARHARVEQNGDNVRIVSPFGSVETTNDSADVARELGTMVYPGASIQKGTASSVSVGSMHTITGQFETGDPIDKVASFYKSKFPEATVSTETDNHYSIVSSANRNIVTVKIEPDGNRTLIHIASVSGTH